MNTGCKVSRTAAEVEATSTISPSRRETPASEYKWAASVAATESIATALSTATVAATTRPRENQPRRFGRQRTDREEDQWRDEQREVAHAVPHPCPRQPQQTQRQRDGDASGEQPRPRGERASDDDHDDHRPGEVPTLARILDRGQLAAYGGDPLVAGPGDIAPRSVGGRAPAVGQDPAAAASGAPKRR